jgi:alpha-tubulin suppressor-like RCC1 family protein
MTYIDCCTPSLPAPPRQFTRRLAPLLVPALVVAALGCREDVESPTAPAPGLAPDIAPAHALAFRQVSEGNQHTCGVTTDNLAYCWGRNFGSLGDGTTTDRLTPVRVAGGLRFRQVSAGDFHTCGVTTDNRAFCWGRNINGQLGDGSLFVDQLTPVAVAGALLFRQVSTRRDHTCGVTTDDRAFCWGWNQFGQLGDGTTPPGTDRPTPGAVAGGLRFRRVSAGGEHTCGVTTDNRGFCWGFNENGGLGDGTTTIRLTPVRVHAGGLRFVQVSAGGGHTCGLTTDNRVYCWGFNSFGQLGDGTTIERLMPVVVGGGRRFRQVSAGGGYTCAVNPFDVAFCWGSNSNGQLGDNTTTQRLSPARLAGGLRFRGVSTGGRHTCGVTTDDRAFCWGINGFGQLGDGTLKSRLRPTAVAGTI